MEMKKFAKRHAARVAAAAAALAAGGAMAQATSGPAAVAQITSEMGDYGPAMFGLAIIGVGIMIGVKWIKRAKGAA